MATTFPGHALHEQDSEHETGPSGSRHSKRGKAWSRACNQPKKASKASEREIQKRHKAIERTIQKAQKEADKKKRSLQSSEPPRSQLSAAGQSELPGIPEEIPSMAWSSDGNIDQDCVLPSNSELLFGAMPAPRSNRWSIGCPQLREPSCPLPQVCSLISPVNHNSYPVCLP